MNEEKELFSSISENAEKETNTKVALAVAGTFLICGIFFIISLKLGGIAASILAVAVIIIYKGVKG